MVAYLEGELGDTVVAGFLADPLITCYAHSINLCEVYYQAVRASGVRIAREAIATLLGDGVVERKDMSRNFWQRVGMHKSRGGISIPDCFCISLAQRLNA